ncbi:hypothetical protein C8R44DRAFT_751453 [Mycena epipterygia]|nr:hypothetical protein C8R44DRAFT_751453 [Mycena epipterygia]
MPPRKSAAKKGKKKQNLAATVSPAATRVRRSSRASRAPRRPDDEHSVAVVPLQPQINDVPAIISPLSGSTPSETIGSGTVAGADALEGQRGSYSLRSQRNFTITPFGSYAGEIDPADPAAEIIQQLLSILPANIVGAVGTPALPQVTHEMDTEDFVEGHENQDMAVIIPQTHTGEAHEPILLMTSGEVTPIAVQDTNVANGPAGRALESLGPRSEYRVGISRVPEDLVGDFMSFRHGFTEVGHLDDVYSAPADSAHVQRARDSDARTAVLASLGLDDSAEMFVVYAYPEHTSPLAAPAGVPSPMQSAAPGGDAARSGVNRYLDEHYAARRDQLRALLNMPGYQSAYKHCLIERQIMSVCNSLGIIFTARQIVAAELEFQGSTIHIRPDDIAAWMDISAGLFATCRTEVAAARAAHLLLRQLVVHEQQGHPIVPPMEPRHRSLLETLNSMMSSRILSPVDPTSGYMAAAHLQAGDASAARMKIATFKTQICSDSKQLTMIILVEIGKLEVTEGQSEDGRTLMEGKRVEVQHSYLWNHTYAQRLLQVLVAIRQDNGGVGGGLHGLVVVQRS